MRSPSILDGQERFARTGRFEQNAAQPCCVALLKTEGLPEYPRFVPPARVRRVQAIVLDLAKLEDSPVAVGKMSHDRSRLALHQLACKGWHGDLPDGANQFVLSEVAPAEVKPSREKYLSSVFRKHVVGCACPGST
jgi:hypothetical protein